METRGDFTNPVPKCNASNRLLIQRINDFPKLFNYTFDRREHFVFEVKFAYFPPDCFYRIHFRRTRRYVKESDTKRYNQNATNDPIGKENQDGSVFWNSKTEVCEMLDISVIFGFLLFATVHKLYSWHHFSLRLDNPISLIYDRHIKWSDRHDSTKIT